VLPAGSTERPCGCRSDQHLADFLPYRAAHLARPATNWSKGMELTAHHASASVEPDAMRVACPCSTEAQRTNPPGIVSQAGNLVVLSDSYCSGIGAMRTCLGSSLLKLSCAKVGASQAKSLRQIRPRGSGLATGSFNVCPRGELSCGDTRNRGATILGDRAKHPTANSSTMKGPKGLVGQCSGRRRRSARSLRKRTRTTTNGLG